MKSSAALTLFSAVSALTMPAALVEPYSAIEERQGTELWKNDDGGNIQVSVGDGKLNFGHVVPSSTLDLIINECTESACKPNQALEMETRLVTVRQIMGIMTKVELEVEGQFAPDGNPEDRNQLIDIARSVMQKLYDEGVAEREQGVPYRTKPCQQTPQNGCRYSKSSSTWHPLESC